MNPGQRCDEIIRLIDEALGAAPAAVPARGADVPGGAGRTGEGRGASPGRRGRVA